MYPMSSTVYLSLVMNLNKDWGGGEHKETSGVRTKSHFQHEDNSGATPRSDTNTNTNNGERREMRVF